jgi:hypothetical protein
MQLKVRQSLKDRIFESYERNKTESGRAIVTRIARDVFGDSNQVTCYRLRKVLDLYGIQRSRPGEYHYLFSGRDSVEARLLEIAKIDAEPETEMQSETDDLDVELYLAIKAKSGCKKAFRILKQLV